VTESVGSLPGRCSVGSSITIAAALNHADPTPGVSASAGPHNGLSIVEIGILLRELGFDHG
jgi:hypothetical protein